jgi:hypothetical protein
VKLLLKKTHAPPASPWLLTTTLRVAYILAWWPVIILTPLLKVQCQRRKKDSRKRRSETKTRYVNVAVSTECKMRRNLLKVFKVISSSVLEESAVILINKKQTKLISDRLEFFKFWMTKMSRFLFCSIEKKGFFSSGRFKNDTLLISFFSAEIKACKSDHFIARSSNSMVIS